MYYDSTVQNGFEELVRLFSSSRNAVRKEKMARKMAEMKRASEREINLGDDEDWSSMYKVNQFSGTKGGARGGFDGVPAKSPHPWNAFHTTSGTGSWGNYSEREDIFDEVDKGLEWCQSQCETAAHKFLQESGGVTEAEAIKTKFGKMESTVLMKLERSKKPSELTKEVSLEDPDFRIPTIYRNPLSVEVDDIDDEGEERDLKSIRGKEVQKLTVKETQQPLSTKPGATGKISEFHFTDPPSSIASDSRTITFTLPERLGEFRIQV